MLWQQILVPLLVVVIASLPSYLNLRKTREVHRTLKEVSSGQYDQIKTRMDNLDSELKTRMDDLDQQVKTRMDRMQEEMIAVYNAVVTYMPRRQRRWWSR